MSAAEAIILVEGYISDAQGAGRYCPTVTLVKSRGMHIVVDPGTVSAQRLIVAGLEKQELAPDDVDMVFITHSHLDHYRHIGMFPRAKALDYWGLWVEDRCAEWQEQLTDQVRVLRTPGHSYDSLSLLVTTDRGAIAVCGDVFWKENYPQDDPYADDVPQLKKTRERLLELADHIIPGHGAMWPVGA